MYETKAIRFVQNGRVFYTVAMPASVLVKFSAVDVWDPENPSKGYQRAPSASRKREIGAYAMKPDAIMPVGGLLNARSDTHTGRTYGSMLQFEQEDGDGDIQYGTLSIPEESLPLYIVDMQHRLGGFEWAMEQDGGEHLQNFPLTVTIADGLSKTEEVDQFDLINTTQKKVRTDLARRLKSLSLGNVDRVLALDQMGKLWEAKGPVVTQILNSTPGVWEGKILPPNKTKNEQPTMVVRETSFVTSLKPILQTPFFSRHTEQHAAELIGRYWSALSKVWPEAFENTDGYVIQKTPGVFALHSIAPEVFELTRSEGDVTESNILKIVRSLSQIGDSGYWASDYYEGAASYGSMKGFSRLAAELRQYLPTLNIGS